MEQELARLMLEVQVELVCHPQVNSRTMAVWIQALTLSLRWLFASPLRRSEQGKYNLKSSNSNHLQSMLPNL